MAMRKIRVGIARGNDLTLFRKAEPSVDAAGRLRADGAVGRAAAACDRAAAAVENGQLDLVFLRDARDLLLRAIQGPVRHQIAAVLVAIRIADHYHLFVIVQLEMLAI